jgi:hypothetical protein
MCYYNSAYLTRQKLQINNSSHSQEKIPLRILIREAYRMKYCWNSILHSWYGIATVNRDKRICIPCRKRSSDSPSYPCWWECTWVARRSCRYVSHRCPSVSGKGTHVVRHGRRGGYIRTHSAPSYPSVQNRTGRHRSAYKTLPFYFSFQSHN